MAAPSYGGPSPFSTGLCLDLAESSYRLVMQTLQLLTDLIRCTV